MDQLVKKAHKKIVKFSSSAWSVNFEKTGWSQIFANNNPQISEKRNQLVFQNFADQKDADNSKVFRV